MGIIGRIIRRARYLLHRDALDRELKEEMRFHIDKETERLVAEGMTPEDARRTALVAFGGVERYRAATREARGTELIEGIWFDLEGAVRKARRSPRFTLALAATVGIGIGANTAIFSVFEAVLLRPMSIPEPDRVATVSTAEGAPLQGLEFFRFEDWRESQESFEALAVTVDGSAHISEGGDPATFGGVRVSQDYFDVIGVEPFLGRAFSPEEYLPDGPDVLIVSHHFWSTRLNGDREVLGRTTTIDGRIYTIVGVMPEHFFWYRNADTTVPTSLWRPNPFGTPALGRFDVIGRLREDVTFEQAAAELQQWGNSIWSYDFELPFQFAPAVEAVQDLTTASRKTPLYVLLGAVSFILLIACLNVGNLLLARGQSRLGEITLRRALGASRMRVARQLLAESLVISIFGAALGVALAFALIPILVSIGPSELIRSNPVMVNRTVLLFAVGLAVAAALITGLAPALRAAGQDLIEELKAHGFGGTGERSELMGRVLVVGEVALATVLAIGCGLFLASYEHVSAVDLGFETRDLTVVETELPRKSLRYYRPVVINGMPAYHFEPAAREFIYEVRASMSTIPGVESAAAGNYPPLPGRQFWSEIRTPDSGPMRRSEDSGPDWGAVYRPVTAQWFETLGIPLVEGRTYAFEEAARGEDVAVIDERLAERLWPGQSAVGRSIMAIDGMIEGWKPFRVVGVAQNVRQTTLHQGELTRADPGVLYFPPTSWAPSQRQGLETSRRHMAFVVRSTRPLDEIAPQLREAVWAHDPELPVRITELADMVGQPASELRFNMRLLLAFAGIALFLAASGVFAVMAYSVARKTREFGIRIALGARTAELERHQLWRGARLVVTGLVLGTAGAVGLTRFIQSYLYGVAPLHPGVYAATGALVVLVALAAAYLPARRAGSVDPMNSLRTE